jgi:hypothetical protein
MEKPDMNDNNKATGQVASANEPLLRLRLVHGHGNPVNAALSVPATGATLAGALELAGQKLDCEQLIEAELCRIDLQGRSWRLSNDSHSLACTLNAVRVPAGKNVPVSGGDVLEVGLLRFVVEIAVPAENDVADFDLRDLAPTSTRAEDPFGALDIDGARPQPAADPLAELLGELPSVHRGAATGQAAPLPAMPAMHVTDGGSADALFNDLYDGFVRAVRDPARLGDSTMWDSGHALSDDSGLKTFDDLTRDAVAAYPLVRDLLHGREKIDQTLDGFASLGSLSLEAEKPHEVLRLFAPELAHSAKTAIPSLTRREHHALSPDSPMPIEWVRQADVETE